MVQESLSKRVQQEAQGITPQTKPDERRKYLGSLRERVLIRLNNQEAQNQRDEQQFLKHVNDYRGYTVLINGKLNNNALIDQIEAACSQKNIAFTMVNDESAKTGPKDTAILVVAKKAINRMRIEINQVYPPELPKQKIAAPQSKKKGFWARLFHGAKK